MRALFVVNYLEHRAVQAAAGIFVDRQADSLRRLGHEVEFFDLGRSFSPPRLFAKWRALRRRIREWRPDVVHAQYGTIVAFVSVLSGHPAVITFGGSDLLPGASVSKARTYLGIAMSNVASLFARRVICVSDEMRRALWWRRRGVSVVPRAVDLDLFQPGDRDAARARIGWPADAPIVLFLGLRDPANKGLPLAQAAVEHARRALPEIQMQSVGGVPPDEMPFYYQAADVFLFTSRQEGSPNVVKEALACNLPVVSVAVGDVEERLAGVTPSRIVARDARALGDALVDVLRERRRSNGREHVAAISSEAIARRVELVYAEALS